MAVAFAVFAGGAWLAWTALGPGLSDGGQSGGSPASPTEPRYEADAFVLEEPARGPVVCLGAIATSLPPQCDGIPVVGWDWDAVDGEEARFATTWGSYHLVGRYDGATFTVLDVGPPRLQQRPDADPVGTPCPQPEGGWTSIDPSKAGDAEVRELMRAMESEPDFAGFWIDYLVDDPTGETAIEPGGVVAVVAFTGEPETHLDRIRELWGGPLCLIRHERTYDELRRIQRELGDGVAQQIGLHATWSAVDVQTNVVQLGVIVAGPPERAAAEQRYGAAVELVPELEPVA